MFTNNQVLWFQYRFIKLIRVQAFFDWSLVDFNKVWDTTHLATSTKINIKIQN